MSNPNDPMFDAKTVRRQEPGIAYNLMSLKDARPHYAHVSFQRNPNFEPPANFEWPPLPGSWRIMHVSRSQAQEFARSLDIDPNPTGSPKQYKYRRARLLRIDPAHLEIFTHAVSITEVPPNDDSASPIVAGAFKRRVQSGRSEPSGPPSGGPVPSGPSVVDGGGPVLLGAVLSDEEIGVHDSGAEAEDGPFVPWTEAGQGSLESEVERFIESNGRGEENSDD